MDPIIEQSTAAESIPEQRNLNKILRPPHLSRLHQVSSENSGPAKAQNLGRYYHR